MINFQNLAIGWLLCLSAVVFVLAVTKEPPVQLPFSLASAESTPELCMDEATREQIKTVMLEALDTALKNHIEHMFEVWLKDERGQPGRARTGVNLGIKSYLGARKGAMEWAPPPCSG
jgi:hypothetical protein